MERYFKRATVVCSGNNIYFWKSKGLSDEMINSITASNYSITPKLSYYQGLKNYVFWCMNIQAQENVVHLVILCSLWLYEVHVFASLCTSWCTG